MMGTFEARRSARLADLGEFRNGVNFSKGKKGIGLGLINVKDIFRDSPKIDFKSLDSVDLAGSLGIERYFVEEGDLFFVRSSVKRDGIGFVAYSDRKNHDAVHCGFVIRFRPDKQKVDYRFLTYALRTPDNRECIRNLSGGAAITNISQGALSTLPLEIPPLPVQRQVADILTAYDELIENNQRRIKILEQMARSLYREWFVNFRFPGYQKIKLVDSRVGKIPEGWESRPVPECVSINPRVSIAREGEKPFVPMSSLANDSMLIGDVESRTGNSGSKFQNGDTLFARITPCLENGKTGFVQFLPTPQSVAFGSTEFIVMRSRTLTPEFVYCLARSDEFRGNAIKSMSGASGRQRVQERCFDGFLIAQPPLALLERFSKIVSPIFHLIQTSQLQTQNLRRTRDLLLPRLLSGQIDLSDVSREEEFAV